MEERISEPVADKLPTSSNIFNNWAVSHSEPKEIKIEKKKKGERAPGSDVSTQSCLYGTLEE